MYFQFLIISTVHVLTSTTMASYNLVSEALFFFLEKSATTWILTLSGIFTEIAGIRWWLLCTILTLLLFSLVVLTLFIYQILFDFTNCNTFLLVPFTNYFRTSSLLLLLSIYLNNILLVIRSIMIYFYI